MASKGKKDAVKKTKGKVANGKGLGRGALGEGGRDNFRPREAMLRVWDFTGRPKGATEVVDNGGEGEREVVVEVEVAFEDDAIR